MWSFPKSGLVIGVQSSDYHVILWISIYGVMAWHLFTLWRYWILYILKHTCKTYKTVIWEVLSMVLGTPPNAHFLVLLHKRHLICNTERETPRRIRKASDVNDGVIPSRMCWDYPHFWWTKHTSSQKVSTNDTQIGLLLPTVQLPISKKQVLPPINWKVVDQKLLQM